MTDQRTVTFEAPLLADAVAKASRIAPTKGAAFDKAAGIMVQVEDGHAVIIATDLDTTYRQEVAIKNSTGFDTLMPELVEWRMSSVMLASFLASLPMGEGSTIRFVDKGDSFMRILSGATVAKLAMIETDNYPLVAKFDTEGMVEANDLAARISMVSWAVDRKGYGPKSGVHIDGNVLAATNLYKLAVVPCVAPVTAPITVAVNSLAHLLKKATDVRIRVENDKFHMTLDAETQATTTIFSGDFPRFAGLFRTQFLGSVTINRNLWIETIQRMLTVVGNDKSPHLAFMADKTTKRLIFDLESPNGDRIRDEIPFSGDYEGDKVVFGCNPNTMLQALQAGSRDTIEFSFGHTEETLMQRAPHIITDDTGYKALVSPKVDTRAADRAAAAEAAEAADE